MTTLWMYLRMAAA